MKTLTNKNSQKIFTHLSVFVFLFFFLVIPTLTLAQGLGLQNPIKVNSISELILIVTRVVRYIAIPFVVVAIMYSGWLYIWGAVSGKGRSEANKALTYTVIGAFILLSAELIALVMKNTIEGLTK